MMLSYAPLNLFQKINPFRNQQEKKTEEETERKQNTKTNAMLENKTNTFIKETKVIISLFKLPIVLIF